MKYAILIAGCNGAGKTTFARQLLPSTYPGAVFLNADEISREDAAFASPVAAGREMLKRLKQVAEAGVTFALETTLSSSNYARRIPEWQRQDYRVVLHFIRLPSADLAVRRVANRVAAGGHGIPEPDIRRRFGRGLELFETRYKALVDDWHLWDSSDSGMTLESSNG